MFEKGRRSVHTNRALRPGDVIEERDIVIKRPGYGVLPRDADKLIGMIVRKAVEEDYWITWDDLR